MENQIERIYSIKVSGFNESLKNLQSLTAAFNKLDKAKAKAVDDLAGAVKSGDTAAVSQLTLKLNEQEKALKALSQQLQKTQKELAQLSKTPAVGQESRKSISEFSLSLKEYQKLVAQNAASQARLNASQSETGKQLAGTREQQRQLNQETKNNVVANQAAEGSLIQMRAQLSLLTRAYDGLGKAERESAKGTEQLEKIKVLNLALSQAEAASGRFQRNVGNYKSAFDGLGVSVAQISRELPSLTISAQQFFLAISNNLPMLADEIAKARKEIAALKAEGKEAPSLFSRLVSATFSWQTLLSVGIVLLTAYGGKLVELVKGLFTSSDAAKLAAANMANYNEVMQSANKSAADELTTLKLLYNAATDVNRPMKDRLENVEALKSEFPEYFAQLSNEVILNGQAKKSYEDLAASILTAARAKAGKDKLDAIEAQKLDVEFQKRKIRNATDNEVERLRQAKPRATSQGIAIIAEQQGITVEEAQRRRDAGLLKQSEGVIEKRRQDALAAQEKQLEALNAQSDFIIKFVGVDNLLKKTLTIEEAKAAKLNEVQLRAVIANIDAQRSSFKEGSAQMKKLDADRDLFQKRLDTYNNKQPKTKPYAGAKLSGEDKDDLKRIEADRDGALNNEALRISKIQEQRKLSFEEEVEHVHALQQINDDADRKKIASIKGTNAEEERLRAALLLSISKRNVEAQREVQDLKDKEFSKDAGLLKKQLATQISTANIGVSIKEADPIATPEQRAQAKAKSNQQILTLTGYYYQALEDLAKKYNVDVSQIEVEKEAASKELLSKSLNDKQLITQAILETYDQATEKAVAGVKLKYDKLRADILKSKQSKSDKDAAITTLGKVEAVEVGGKDLEGLNTKVAAAQKLYDAGLITLKQYEEIYAKAQEGQEKLNASIEAGKTAITSFTGLAQSGLSKLFGFAEGSDKSKVLGETISSAFSTASAAMNSYFDGEQRRIQQSLKAQEKRLSAEKDIALSGAQSQAEKESIEKQFTAKKDAANREAFEKNKKLQIEQAKINLATQLSNLAVIAFAPNPLNIATLGVAGAVMYGVQAALAFANYAANVKRIQSAQPFATGGQVKPVKLSSGKIITASNIPQQRNGDNILATVRIGEAILNEEQIKRLGGAKVLAAAGVPGFAAGGRIEPLGGNRTWGENLMPPINPSSFLRPVGAIDSGEMKTVMQKINEQTANIDALSKNVAVVSANIAQVSAQTNQRVDRIQVVNDARQTVNVANKIAVANKVGTL